MRLFKVMKRTAVFNLMFNKKGILIIDHAYDCLHHWNHRYGNCATTDPKRETDNFSKRK